MSVVFGFLSQISHTKAAERQWRLEMPAQQKEEPALRFDAGKARFDLLPFDAIEELVQVYTKGAEKYAERNWEKGMSYSRVLGSLLRHLWKFWRGKSYDDGPEGTGCHHMALVAWNALALLTYDIRKVGIDDRK